LMALAGQAEIARWRGEETRLSTKSRSSLEKAVVQRRGLDLPRMNASTDSRCAISSSTRGKTGRHAVITVRKRVGV
jgi:hypothetical protein